MSWLEKVLADHSGLKLGDEFDRAQLAQAIADAAPRQDISAAIRDSAHAVLVQRGITDGGNMLSHEIGNNAAQTVLLTIAGLT